MRRPAETQQPDADHWLLHKREAKRRRIDMHTIVEEAHSLVHEGGSAALSMRSLASALRTSTSALYRHFPSKQWLLIAIVDYVFAEVDTSLANGEGTQARERLRRLSSSFHGVLSTHPHLHEILTSHVAVTPSTMRIAEAALGCLRDLGIREAELVDAYNAWAGYVIGFTAIEAKPPELAPDRELQRAMRRQLERATPGELPIISALMPEAANLAYGLSWLPGRLGEASASFGWGLEALLDGFETRARPRRGR